MPTKRLMKPFFQQMMAEHNPQLKVENVRDKRGITRYLGRIAFNLFLAPPVNTGLPKRICNLNHNHLKYLP